MKIRKTFVVLVVYFAAVSASHAAEPYRFAYRTDTPLVLTDLIVARPLGLVGTVVGTALFIGLSPFTALAAIAPPHDAFARTADILIAQPAAYTFVRPLGAFYE